jgi:ABC-2 type transport system ATP-binding protein
MLVEIRNLGKKYSARANYAIREINIVGNEGEIIGILGHNGAGKSTTIKCITGMHPYEEGSIHIAGHDLARQPLKAKQNFGYVSDEHILFEKMTGQEYVDFMGDIYGVSVRDRRDRIKKFQEIFQLGDSIYKPISSYSHGMKQKISLMGALIHNPKVFILDEPMVGLDPRAAHLLKEEMRNHCKKGNTVFFSTHVLEVAEKLCDRIGIIAHGKLVATGTIEELREKASQDGSLESIFLSVTGE